MEIFSCELFQCVAVGLEFFNILTHCLDFLTILFHLPFLSGYLPLCFNPMNDRVSRAEQLRQYEDQRKECREPGKTPVLTGKYVPYLSQNRNRLDFNVNVSTNLAIFDKYYPRPRKKKADKYNTNNS